MIKFLYSTLWVAAEIPCLSSEGTNWAKTDNAISGFCINLIPQVLELATGIWTFFDFCREAIG